MADPASAPAEPLPGDKSTVVDAVLKSWRKALPEADVTSVSVSITVSRLAALFNRGAEELARRFGFGYGEMEVLFYLLSTSKPHEMRPSDLLKGSFVTSGAITGRVDRLAKLGLVMRIPSLVDRRELLVRLTRDGVKLARRLQTIVAFESTLAMALDELPKGRRAALDNELRLLLARVEARVEGDVDAVAPARRKRG